MNKAKSKGTAWEKAIQDYLRDNGYDVERLRTTGAKDEGDLVVRDDGMFIIVEAKATQALLTSSFLSQALLEGKHFSENRGIPEDRIFSTVVWKRPGKPVKDAVVLTTLEEFFK